MSQSLEKLEIMEVRNEYIDKKNMNDNPDKKSRSLYAETINEMYRRYNKAAR